MRQYLEGMEQRWTGRLDKLDGHLDKLDARLDGVEEAVRGLGAQLEAVHRQVRTVAEGHSFLVKRNEGLEEHWRSEYNALSGMLRTWNSLSMEEFEQLRNRVSSLENQVRALIAR